MYKARTAVFIALDPQILVSAAGRCNKSGYTRLEEIRENAVGSSCLMPEPSCEQRFEEWDPRHRDRVRAFVFAMVRRADVAEDLTQDVFCLAWEARESYREQGKCLAYLLKIADRLVCRWSRQRRLVANLDQEGWKCHEPVSRAVAPLDVAARSEQMALLAEAMERLSPIQRRVLLLRYYGQLGFAEIADVTETPLNTVLSHCRRGMEALRSLLGPNL